MKLIMLLALLVGVTVTRAATNAVPSRAEQEQLFTEAVLLSKRGFYAEAEVRLKRLVELQPNQLIIAEFLRLVQVKLHDPAEILTKRLAAITFPVVQFRAANLPDVIEYLREEIPKLAADKTEINFVWQVPANTPMTPITLNLRNIPLPDVLNYVTQLAGLRYRVEPNAVVIYKPEPATPANVQSE